MAVFGYVRVSSSEQTKSGLSLREQRDQVAAWAQLNGLGRITAIYEDAGVSGGLELQRRPAGAKLLKRLAKGDVLIVTRLDRMFRKALDALNTVEEFKRKGIALHVRDLQGDVSGNGISKLFLTIMSAVAEWERSIISDRQRDAKRQMATQGRFLGGKRKTGVRRVERNGVILAEVDENERRAIDYIAAHRSIELKALQSEIKEKFDVVKSISTISRIRKDGQRYSAKADVGGI